MLPARPQAGGKDHAGKAADRGLLEGGVPPYNILYYALDAANTNRDIVDAVESWRRISAGHRKDCRIYIFLDGISPAREWQKGIKWMSDTGWLENCTVLVTGSHTIDVRRSAERLPGRREEVDGSHDMVLNPTRFSELASIANEGVKDRIAGNGPASAGRRNSVFKKLASMEIDGAVDSLAAYRIDLDDIMQDFMIAGGMPEAVGEKKARRR